MKWVIRVVGVLLCSISLSQAGESEHTLLVPSDVLADYHRWLGDRDPLTIENFSGPGARRDVVEVALVQQAIDASGASFDLRLEPEDRYDVILERLVDGTALATGTSAWLDDLMPRFRDIHITTALIGRGQFEAGFYVHPDNPVVQSVSDQSDLSALVGISSRAWQADWDTLSELDLHDLIHVDHWNDMVDAVVSHQADFLLAPFQATEGMVLSAGDAELVPIEGLKLGLVGSRHMAISRSHPDGGFFNSALQLGLLRLKEAGRVDQAYADAGFYHPEVEDWTLITVKGGASRW